VEQHVGFALAAASRYYVMKAGRIASTGAGGAEAHDQVPAAMAI
jgi:urea transport system ATP-binding protein